MSQDQYERETNFRISFSIFKQLYKRGLLTADQLKAARQKLIKRFNPPIGVLTDIIASVG